MASGSGSGPGRSPKRVLNRPGEGGQPAAGQPGAGTAGGQHVLDMPPQAEEGGQAGPQPPADAYAPPLAFAHSALSPALGAPLEPHVYAQFATTRAGYPLPTAARQHANALQSQPEEEFGLAVQSKPTIGPHSLQARGPPAAAAPLSLSPPPVPCRPCTRQPVKL